jgi:DNA-directed RNA polymerase specialized sigma24 family protein
MKTTTIRKTLTHDSGPDTQQQDDFDDLVRRAAHGDRRAIGAIAIAFGPSLLDEARHVLGPHEHEAEDVLQDFFLTLLEGGSRFVPAHGSAIRWMGDIIRTIALRRRTERDRDRGDWRDP